MTHQTIRTEKRDAQRGFTLIELSIVLVIIGLLVGGVIKGQELIRGARQSNLENAFQGYIAAANNYMGTYRALPGDDPRADRWQDEGGNDLTAGDGDGVLDGGEEPDFWQHLRAAGLIAGAAGDAEDPTTPFGTSFFVQNDAYGMNGTVICAQGIPGEVVQRMEIKLDDGAGDTGDIRVGDDNANDAAGTAALQADSDYGVCMRL